MTPQGINQLRYEGEDIDAEIPNESGGGMTGEGDSGAPIWRHSYSEVPQQADRQAIIAVHSSSLCDYGPLAAGHYATQGVLANCRMMTTKITSEISNWIKEITRIYISK